MIALPKSQEANPLPKEIRGRYEIEEEFNKLGT